MLPKSALSALFRLLIIRVAFAQDQCHDYVLMSARGTSEPQGPSEGFVGMINSTLSTLPNGIEYDVVYPAALNLSAIEGADDIVRYLNVGLSSCPDQKYAILGYSQGAAAASLALARFTNTSNATYQAIKAVVVIGNPGHAPNVNGNVDQFGGNTTQNYTGAVYLNGALALPEIYYNESKILDICYQGDPICASGYRRSNFRNHSLYGADENVQRMGADFMINKLGGSTNGSSTGGQPSATNDPATSTSQTSVPGMASGVVSDLLFCMLAMVSATVLHLI